MRLKPRDLAKLARLKHSAERSPREWGAAEEADAAELRAVDRQKADGMVQRSIPTPLARRLEKRVADDVVDLSYGIRVIYTTTGTLRHLSMSRKGKPDVPLNVRTQILEVLGFRRAPDDMGKMGRALHVVEAFDLPVDA